MQGSQRNMTFEECSKDQKVLDQVFDDFKSEVAQILKVDAKDILIIKVDKKGAKIEWIIKSNELNKDEI